MLNYALSLVGHTPPSFFSACFSACCYTDTKKHFRDYQNKEPHYMCIIMCQIKNKPPNFKVKSQELDIIL